MTIITNVYVFSSSQICKICKMCLDIKLLELFKYCYHFESSLFTYVMKKKSLK